MPDQSRRRATRASTADDAGIIPRDKTDDPPSQDNADEQR